MSPSEGKGVQGGQDANLDPKDGSAPSPTSTVVDWIAWTALAFGVLGAWSVLKTCLSIGLSFFPFLLGVVFAIIVAARGLRALERLVRNGRWGKAPLVSTLLLNAVFVGPAVASTRPVTVDAATMFGPDYFAPPIYSIDLALSWYCAIASIPLLAIAIVVLLVRLKRLQ